MPSVEVYKERIKKELLIAGDSRKQGNEGRVRVCARRAAGIALTYYFEQQNEILVEQDAMDLLKRVESINTFPPELQQAAARLTKRVSTDFQYASQSDAIEDAKEIIKYIFTTITQ